MTECHRRILLLRERHVYSGEKDIPCLVSHQLKIFLANKFVDLKASDYYEFEAKTLLLSSELGALNNQLTIFLCSLAGPQVMDRYVDPLVSHLKAMLNYRKFKKGTKAEVDELLRIEKLEYPMRIVYCFGISHEHPGTFILTFVRSTNPHHEYVGLYPKGFKFRKRMFEDIDRLVAYFQRHIDDPQSAQSLRSVAARVPMRSPATGGSSGASGGSGWGGSTDEDNWRGQSYDRDRSSTPGSRTGNSAQISDVLY